MKTQVAALCGFLAGISVTLVAFDGVKARASQVQVVKRSSLNAVHVGQGKAHAWPLVRGEQAFVGVLELAAGGAVPEHRDPTEEYLYVMEGSGTISINDKMYEIGPGHAIYMPAKAKVSFQNGAKKLVVVQVFAKPGPEAKYKKWKAGVWKAPAGVEAKGR